MVCCVRMATFARPSDRRGCCSCGCTLSCCRAWAASARRETAMTAMARSISSPLPCHKTPLTSRYCRHWEPWILWVLWLCLWRLLCAWLRKRQDNGMHGAWSMAFGFGFWMRSKYFPGPHALQALVVGWSLGRKAAEQRGQFLPSQCSNTNSEKMGSQGDVNQDKQALLVIRKIVQIIQARKKPCKEVK